MKKFGWFTVLSAMLLFMSVAVFSGTHEVTEPQTSSIDAGESLEMQDSFFVQSLPCPTDIMEYVSENSKRFIRSMCETQSLDYDTITVGHPFTYGDKVPLFIFPVYSGNKAVYTIRATYTPDGSISSTRSTFLADELNAYRNRTSQDCPLLFDVVDNTLCACLGDVVEEVYVFHQGESVNPQSVNFDRIAPKLEIVDIAAPIDSQEAYQVTPYASMSLYLPLSITETQGNETWCSAYATAAIMRTQTGDSSHTASIDAGESLEMQDSFFVQSLPCPTDIMEYVSENSMSFIRSLDETQSLDYDTITVGHPFTYGDKVPLFIFPVYSGNKAVYTIRATYAPDGSISGTGSTFLADELNAYRNRTSQDCPLLFDVVDNTLYACLGDVMEEVYVFHRGESVNPQSFNFDRIAPKLEIVDIAAPI